ncbi:hypothetical protein ACHAXA_000883 [Cyclostephanos tholiformis]|uniref:Uncharacterized protein n=1 Tax=Cyclostephanos tholiformis TaxID=382380 RepID=A0ABD3RLR8_9STRA
MNEVLMGGRGEQKRLYSVDETLYGTEEGAKLALEAQEKAKKKAERTRRRNTKKAQVFDEGSVEDNESAYTGGNIVKSSVVTVAVVGALAASSFFLGGRRSQ